MGISRKWGFLANGFSRKAAKTQRWFSGKVAKIFLAALRLGESFWRKVFLAALRLSERFFGARFFLAALRLGESFWRKVFLAA
jgi:hypothetical protein